VDKLDGKVDPGMFEQLPTEWRKQQDKCLREIERHQAADQSYLEEGMGILDIAAVRLLGNQGKDALAIVFQNRTATAARFRRTHP
jgi:site-specific DNA recombinase